MASSIHLTGEHHSFRAEVRRFLESEVAPRADDWEAAGRLPRSIWRRLGELGLLGVALPEAWGGAGGDLLFAMVLLEELPRSLMGGFCAAVSVQQYMATRHILEWGSDELRERYLRPSIEGRAVGALAVTEPDAGSDVAGLATHAGRDGDHWVVDGAKTYITNGCDGDFATVAVRTGGAGAGGISLLVMDLDRDGVTVARRLSKLGWHASDTAELVFEGVRVPAGNLVGEAGMGFAYLMEGFQLERLAAAAISVGSAELCLERTATWLRRRSVFGRPLATHQALSHRLAELAARLAAVRQLTYHAAWLLDRRQPAVAECTAAKLLATELAVAVADFALQAHGGFGYMEEAPYARFVRDARAGTIAGGTSEIMREILARILLEGPPPAPPASASASVPAPDPGIASEPEPDSDADSAGEPPPTPTAPPATAEDLIRALPDRFRAERAGDAQATVHYVIAGAEPAEWTIRVADGACTVVEGHSGDPDCVVRTDAASYVGMESGGVNPQVAYMTGRLKVSNLAVMLRVVKLFRRVG